MSGNFDVLMPPRETDRQTDRQTDTDRETDRETDTERHRERDRQTTEPKASVSAGHIKLTPTKPVGK